MPVYFLEPGTRPADGRLTVTGETAAHLTRSLRVRPGERLVFSDGETTVYETVAETVGKDTLTALVAESKSIESDDSAAPVLCQALTKGDKFDTIVQKAAELGAGAIRPVLTERCVSRPDEKTAEKKRERWQRIAREAARQCGRLRVPAVEAPMTLAAAARRAADEGRLLLCLYEKERSLTLRRALAGEAGRPAAFFVGPEGGFTEAETEALCALGGRCVTLGRRILRTETAGPAALAMLVYEREL